MKRQISLERTFRATLAEVWELWTTRDGIEAWWGPEGFCVQVHALDLRAGGALVYSMIAMAPEQIAFMKRAGMPLAHEATIRFTEVTPPTRLAYLNVVDFVPSVDPYEAATVVELVQHGADVRMTLTFDVMHDAEWTSRATAGWQSELGKLERVLTKSNEERS